MKILIVDDEYRKVEEISSVLHLAEIVGLDIKHDTTAHEARKRLQNTDFDILIIDLHLPDGIGAKPNDDGGISFFDMIKLDSKVKLPADVLFITGKEELMELANTEVTKRGGVLCQYRSDSNQWKDILKGRVQYTHQRLTNNTQQIDIAIITALRNPELDAVLKLPYEWKQKRFRGDPLTYYFGSIHRPDGNISVVTVSPNKKGMPSSAVVASKLALMFRPKYLVMLGICAGIKNKCNLGDVIVADPTWDWGSGKRGIDSNGSPVFQAAPHQMPLNIK
jgi:CheY-like chemotaxis protein